MQIFRTTGCKFFSVLYVRQVIPAAILKPLFVSQLLLYPTGTYGNV